MLRIAVLGAVFVAILAALPGCGKPPNEVAAAKDPRVVLVRFEAPPVAFEVSVDDSVDGRNALKVLLKDGSNKVSDTAVLPVSAYTKSSRKETIDTLWGADPGSEALATGEETEYVGIAATLVTITPRQKALLITERYGFEHLKRQHILYTTEAGKLKNVWSAEEAAGPTWSAVRLIPSQDAGAQDIAYFDGFLYPSNQKADRIEVTRLHWDQSGKLQKAALPDAEAPLFVLNAGVFGSVAQARKARAADPACLSGFWVLGSEAYPGLFAGKALLGMIYIRREETEHAVSETAKCSDKLKPAALEYRGARAR